MSTSITKADGWPHLVIKATVLIGGQHMQITRSQVYPFEFSELMRPVLVISCWTWILMNEYSLLIFLKCDMLFSGYRWAENSSPNDSMADEAKDPSNKSNSENKLRAAAVLQRKYRSMSTYGEQVIDDANRSNKALFCLPEDNPVRFYCKKIVESKYPFPCSEQK